MRSCIEKRNKAYLAVLLLLVNVIIIMYITKYIDLGLIILYSIFMSIYLMRWIFTYLDCTNN